MADSAVKHKKRSRGQTGTGKSIHRQTVMASAEYSWLAACPLGSSADQKILQPRGNARKYSARI
jgi:hypothetical protein